jgi:hypothetical protein
VDDCDRLGARSGGSSQVLRYPGHTSAHALGADYGRLRFRYSGGAFEVGAAWMYVRVRMPQV